MPLSSISYEDGVKTRVFSFDGLTFDGDPSGVSYDTEIQLIAEDGGFISSADWSVTAE